MPTNVRRRRWSAGVAAAAAAALLAPTSAQALEFVDAETKAELDPEGDVNGLKVNLNGVDHTIRTLLIGVTADSGAALKTYCVELATALDYDNPDMIEVPWDSYPNPDSPFHQNRDKIHWILQNSYPSADLAELEATVGAEFDGGLSAEEAITATQAAIWSFSDGSTLDANDPTTKGAGTDADVLALYGYLTGEDNVGIGDQPEPELRLEPASLSGEAGEVIGPFSVTTTADELDVSSELPDGVSLVDADGNPLEAPVTDGAQINVDVPEDAEAGDGSFMLSGEAALNVGRLFIGADYENTPTQSLILAQSEKTELQVEGMVDWAAKPTPTPTPTPTETPTPTPTPTETPTESPTPTETPTETPSESPTPSPTETPELPDTGTSPGLLVTVGLVLIGAAGFLLRRRLIGAAE